MTEASAHPTAGSDSRRFRRRLVIVGLLSAGIAVAGLSALLAYLHRDVDCSARLEAFAGGRRVRAVWGRDLHRKRGYDIMALDSRDGRGPRTLFHSRIAPRGIRISRSGRHVLFSEDVTRVIHIIDFETGAARTAPTRGSMEDVWLDPATSVDWAYILDYSAGAPVVRRFRIDTPEIVERVCTGPGGTTGNSDGKILTVAGDGRTFGGHTVHPHCGVWRGSPPRFTPFGIGCFPGIAPDHSGRFFHFDGAHKNLLLYSRDAARIGRIALGALPEVKGYEAYHPRWTNDADYFVFAGPMTEWGASNDMTEVFLARFTADGRGIAGHVPISDNRMHDFAPMVWIEPAADRRPVRPPVTPPDVTPDPPPTKGAPDADPDRRLVWRWANSRQSPLLARADGREVSCSVAPHGAARYGRHFEMEIAGGGFRGDELVGLPTSTTAGDAGFTLELVVTAARPASTATPAAIVTAESVAEGREAWALLQSGGRMLFRVAGGAPVEIGALPPGRPCPVVLVRTAEGVTASVDGVTATLPAGAGLPPIEAPGAGMRLRFGPPPGAAEGWTGHVGGVSLHARPSTGPELESLVRRVREDAGRRKPAERLVVRAVLETSGRIPEPKDILPYRRCLLECTWRIEQTLSGGRDGGRIVVAHWAVMDGKAVPDVAAMQPGLRRVMVLEAFDDHPQLVSERRVSEVEDVDLPVYYEVSSEPDAK